MHKSIVYLVLIVLALVYLASGLKVDKGKKIVKNNLNRIMERNKTVNYKQNKLAVRPVSKVPLTTSAPKSLVKNVKRVDVKPSNKLPVTDLELVTIQPRGRPKKPKKHKMNQTLMALLLAYKLKFAALIPTFVMGVFLLLGTTGLAGFFFALFAAILGLKSH